MSYWAYQHIGNLAPGELHDDEMYDTVCGAEDGAHHLSRFAKKADRETEGTRWCYARHSGGVHDVVIDSCEGRDLEIVSSCMVDDEEWEWIFEHLVGGHDHLIVA